jgi:hypothetical protein
MIGATFTMTPNAPLRQTPDWEEHVYANSSGGTPRRENSWVSARFSCRCSTVG